MSLPAIDVSHLSKTFGVTTAVRDISFALDAGEVVGFLGPNGAGKSTTLQMLLGTLTPTSGTISYFGRELRFNKSSILQKVGFCPALPNLPWELTVIENLTYISFLYAVPKRKVVVESLIDSLDLRKLQEKKMVSLSSGELTRVHLAKALLNSPSVLLLDEPTANLDPVTASLVRALLIQQRDEHGTAILFASHNMQDVERLCSRVIFVDQGVVVADGNPADLVMEARPCVIKLWSLSSEAMDCFAGKLTWRWSTLVTEVELPEADIPALLQTLANNRMTYSRIEIDRPTLEDYYLKRTGTKRD